MAMLRSCRNREQASLSFPAGVSARGSGPRAAVTRAAAGAAFVAGGPPLELLAAWPRTSPPDACPNPPIVFAREFFVSASKERNAELATALRPSLRGNPCGLHRFVVSDAAWASNLEEFQKEAGVAVEVYYAQLILMAHLFEAAGLKSPLGGGPGSVFVASTADVAVPNMDAVPVACGDAFKPQRRAVLVMSRVDMHKKEMDCERYKALGSFDVYVAAADLVTPQVMFALQVPPYYCGVENLSAFALAGGSENVFNLCPKLQVEHYHKTDRGPMWRTRVNHADNNAEPRGALYSVCDLEKL